jgi:class 3 adenylate cyclase
LNAVFVGLGVGFFEQFYVQSLRGRHMRNIHPPRAILIYTVVVVIMFFIAIHLSHLLLWPFYRLTVPCARLPLVLPFVVTFAVVMRIVHFVGLETLFHLTVGTYHRPVVQKKILLFLDINNSTGLSERLGPVQTKSLVGKFFFNISKPITDHGGEIYQYKGDGLTALWDWQEAVRENKILWAIDAVFATIGRERGPGGKIVVSAQGDTKRAIGVYGSTINIAARMEEAAKVHNVACAISGDVTAALPDNHKRLVPIGGEKIRGIAVEIPILRILRCRRRLRQHGPPELRNINVIPI